MMTPKQKIRARESLTTANHDYRKGLTSRAFFKTHNRMLSEDLVQDTFMKTWVYLVKGGKVDTMRAFLYHVLNNLIVDEYRKNKTISLDTLLDKGFDPSVDPTESLLNKLDGKALLLLIERLPQKYQKVIHMRYIQHLSLKEMALITGQPKNTVAVQAHRGLKKLKLLYKDFHKESQ